MSCSLRPTDDAGLLNASMSSISSLMVLQFFSRMSTFILNQALLRLVSPQAFGTAAIQFELLLNTILFLSREGVRNAVLRSSESAQVDDDQAVAAANLTLMPVTLGLPLTLVFISFYGRFASADTRGQPHFKLAVGVYAVAAVIELLSEPMHSRTMRELRTYVRVRAEGVAILTKSVVPFLVLLHDFRSRSSNGQLSLIAFALGQLAYATSILGMYVHYYGRRAFRLQRIADSPSKSKERSFLFFDPEMLKLSLSMTFQSFIKHLLTEGDKLILSWLSPLRDQGGYAIAVNYGSLIARIVFQPIEEMSRVFFSKVLSSTQRTLAPARRSLEQASSALLSLLSTQISLTVILLAFGSAYMPFALQVLPPQYSSTSAPKVLSAWIWYIPVLAVNGGLEAFVSSAVNSHDLIRQSRWMAFFSAIYIGTAVGLYRLGFGDVALVYANIINLSARIVYSLHFISRFFHLHGGSDLIHWTAVMPRWELLSLAGFSRGVIWCSDRVFGASHIVEEKGIMAIMTAPVLLHVALGATLAFISLATWWQISGSTQALPGRVKTE